MKPNKQGVWVAVRSVNNLTAYDLVADEGTETNVKNQLYLFTVLKKTN